MEPIQAGTVKNGTTTNRYMSNKNINAVTTTSTTSIEDLYKYFGTLADAKDKAGQVCAYFFKI